MGTDINLYAERRQPNGTWTLANGMEPNEHEYFGGDEHYPKQDSPPWPPMVPVEAFDVERDYELFSILANVRNGIRTAEGALFEYLAAPRGLPGDLSPELREYADVWDDSFFAATWLGLTEIFAFPWKEKAIVQEAMVDARVAPLFGYQRPPFGGQGWEPPKEPRKDFPFNEWPEGVPISYGVYKRDGVTVRWLQSYEQVGRNFLKQLEPLRALGDTNDTRLVFWFH